MLNKEALLGINQKLGYEADKLLEKKHTNILISDIKKCKTRAIVYMQPSISVVNSF